MKNILFWALITVMAISATALTACSPKAGEQVHAADEPLENALLWEISGNDLEHTSYLFGTIHLISAEDFFWPAGTLSAFEKTEKVVFEIDMNEMTDIGSQLNLFQMAFMRDNTTLSDLMSEEDYELVSEHFQNMGLPMFMMERIKPMFLTILTGDSDFGGMDLDLFGSAGGNTKSYEIELNNLAEAAGKPVAGLESVEFQISLFDSIPYKMQADMLVESIKNPGNGDAGFDEIVNIYTSQDIEAMAKMIKDDDAGFGDFTYLILESRNKAWIEPMIEKMRQQPVFFAVGAGHLGGEEGVIRLLREEGYTLTPVKD